MRGEVKERMERSKSFKFCIKEVPEIETGKDGFNIIIALGFEINFYLYFTLQIKKLKF